MSKVTLDSIASGFDLSKVNANFQKIQTELNTKVLYRTNPVGEDNVLNSDIDINGKVVYNLPEPTLLSQAATKKYVDDRTSFDSNAAQSAAEAAASAAAALISENNALASANTAEAAALEASLYVPLEWEGTWLTGTTYQINDAVKLNGSSYICLVAHTSGTFATDLAALKWDVIAEKGLDGSGAGDMLKSENLSGLTDYTTARSNLGLGSAALNNTGDFATAGHLHTGVYEPVDASLMRNNIETDIAGAITHTEATLTDGVTINWNLDTQQNAKVVLGGNRTVAAPSNAKSGRYVGLKVVQDATGSRTLIWNGAYKGLTGRVMSTTANAVDFFLFRCIDTTNIACVGFTANCEA